jgi:hypothetical protein
MTTQHTPRSTGPALFGLMLVTFLGDAPDEGAVSLSHLVCTLAGELFHVLPCVLLTVCQALEAYSLDHEPLVACFHLLVSSRPLLHYIFRAV